MNLPRSGAVGLAAAALMYRPAARIRRSSSETCNGVLAILRSCADTPPLNVIAVGGMAQGRRACHTHAMKSRRSILARSSAERGDDRAAFATLLVGGTRRRPSIGRAKVARNRRQNHLQNHLKACARLFVVRCGLSARRGLRSAALSISCA